MVNKKLLPDKNFIYLWSFIFQLAKKGSFLSRQKESLMQIAQAVKGSLGGGTSGKAKHFVFQTGQEENEVSY